MRFVVPVDVTDANLTTNVVNDYTDWSAGTYNLGDRAVEGESVYEVVADPTTTHQPSVGAALATPEWILLGYSNIWRMFRDGADSVSDAVGDIEVSLPVPTPISTVGVLNAEGLDANVRLVDSSIMNIEPPVVENIAGTKDGSNTAFTISAAGTLVLIFLNKIKLTEGTGYTKSGTDITATGAIPESGDVYIAEIYGTDAPAIENIAGTKDGSNTSFTVTEAAGIARIFLNGQELADGTGYTRAGTAITAIAVPFSGDLYEAVIFTGNLPTVESVTGTKDGSNTAFLISTAGVALLSLNGLRLTEGVDYTRSGTSITAITIPYPGDDYEAIVFPDIAFPGGVIYDSTQLLTDIGVGDWWAYFFTGYERSRTVVFDDLPAYFGAGVTVEVTIHATGISDPSSVGRVSIGPGKYAGQSLQNVRSRNLTFSIIERNPFGDLTLVTRRTIRVVDFPVMIPAGDTYSVQQAAASIAATPTLFIGDPNKPATVVFGVIESFDVIVSGVSIDECSIGVQEF